MVYVDWSVEYVSVMLLKDVKPESGQKIWAHCLNQDGAKTFFAKTCDAMWDHMQNRPRHFSEVVQDAPCHLFFDLDEGDVHATWKRIQPLIDAFLNMLELTYHHVLLDASTETKGSLHVITRASKFVLASPVQGKQFVQQLESIHNVSLGLDTSIYTRNRCFRMLGNTKYGSSRILRGAWTKKFWLQTLVQPSVVLETVTWGPKYVPRALNDHSDVPPCAKAVMDHIGAERCLRMPMSWTWTGQLTRRVCKLANRQHRSNNNYYVFHMDSATVVAKCHACEGRWQLPVPNELLQDCASFLRTSVDE